MLATLLSSVASAVAAASSLKSAHVEPSSTTSILAFTLKTCAYVPSGLAGGGGDDSVVGASVVSSGVVVASSAGDAASLRAAVSSATLAAE